MLSGFFRQDGSTTVHGVDGVACLIWWWVHHGGHDGALVSLPVFACCGMHLIARRGCEKLYIMPSRIAGWLWAERAELMMIPNGELS